MRTFLRRARLVLPLAALLAAGIASAGNAPPATEGDNLRRSAVPADAPLDLDVLRVCSDPNSLPQSNRAEEGYENRLAELVARDLGGGLEYAWRAQRRGFIREMLNAGRCDVVMGLSTGHDVASTTRPYDRSTYVFLVRADIGPHIESLDDRRLRTLRVGVHVIGDDYANTPGAHALGKRGIVDNVRGYSIFGDYGQPNPPARLVEAVAGGGRSTWQSSGDRSPAISRRGARSSSA